MTLRHHSFALLLLLPMLLIATGCGSDSVDEPMRPSLDPSRLDMLVGETLQLTVLHATTVSVSFNSDIAELRTDDTRIFVTALRAGSANITVMADGHRLVCPLNIVGYNSGEEDSEQEAKQLADASSRFVSNELRMDYSTHGTIVEASADFSRFAFESLATGDYAIFSCGEATPAVGVLEGASLEVNGSDVPLLAAEVMQVRPGAIWLRLRTRSGGQPIWIVVSDV